MGTDMPAPAKHIRLTSHPVEGAWGALPIHWGARRPEGARADRRQHREPQPAQRDRHALRLLRRLPRARGRRGRARSAGTSPTSPTPRRPIRSGRTRSGAIRSRSCRSIRTARSSPTCSRTRLAAGYDIRPTIAVTKAHIDMPEVRGAIAAGRLMADGSILHANGDGGRHQGRDRAGLVPARRREALRRRTRPSCAARCSSRPAACSRSSSRAATSRCSCRRSAARPSTCSAIRSNLADPTVTLTARVHDECNGSDVFGSDICTCRPYLTHAIEECIRGAQAGGVGLDRLLPQGRPRARRGHEVPRLQRAQAPGGRRLAPTSTSRAPSASPACRTCASRS